MSNGGVPECNPACQKIILDGDTLESAATDTCEMLKRHRDDRIAHLISNYQHPERVVLALIAAEAAVFHVQRVALEELGYNGPWPQHLPAS